MGNDAPSSTTVPPVVSWFAPWRWFAHWKPWKRWTAVVVVLLGGYIEAPVMIVATVNLTGFDGSSTSPAVMESLAFGYHTVFFPIIFAAELSEVIGQFYNIQIDALATLCGG